jgi:hypothetical protein
MTLVIGHLVLGPEDCHVEVMWVGLMAVALLKMVETFDYAAANHTIFCTSWY